MRACRHWRRIHLSVAIAPATAILLLVVWGEHSEKSQRPTLSPAGASMSAAFPPGLGLELSLPRQLSSAWTRMRIGGLVSAISRLDDHRDVGVAEDLLRVGDHDRTGAAGPLSHVGARQQRVAPEALDHARHHRTGPAGLDVGHEGDALHREAGLGLTDHLEPGVAVL